MAWLPFALGPRWGIHTIIRANLAVRGVIVGDQIGFGKYNVFISNLSFDIAPNPPNPSWHIFKDGMSATR